MLFKIVVIVWIFLCLLVTESDTLEVARHKPTKQSTNWSETSGLSGNAVDGEYTQHMTLSEQFCTHTHLEDKSSWWAVDLGAIYDITNVIIYGRNDYAPAVERLSNFDIEVIKPCRNRTYWFEDGTIQLCYHQQAPITFLNASCNYKMIGQYVRIRLNDPNPLTLCEVEVHGTFIRYLRSVTVPYTCGFQGQSYAGHNVTLSSAIVKSGIYCTYMCAFMRECYVADFNKKTSNCTLMEKKTGSNVVADSDHDVFFIN
ncbi:fucolectin-3-like [Mytilus trossulus]|uniref:fucolectin-3-like n=1 Tax=Mytilus trossulus TaxID=6551 RepID=UPI003006CA9F